MAGTIINNGDGTFTIELSYTALAIRIQARADAAAHRLYNTGRYVPVDAEDVAIPWDDLTNQQKVDMLDEFVFDGIYEEAMGYLHNARHADADAYREEDAATIL